MVCYNPNIAVYDENVITRIKSTGELKVVPRLLGPYRWFSEEKRAIFDSDRDKYIRVPCHDCIGCRMDHAAAWAARCVLEASQYDSNCFITLTFDEDNLIDDSLHPEFFVKFMKRLRKKYGSNIRFFHAGEYGDLNGRPHHHAIIFNFDFPDKYLYKIHPTKKYPIFRSPSLEKLWPFGFSTIGECNFKTCSYVARYVLKKQKLGSLKYEGVIPEYTTMSRRPGIAADWFSKFYADVYSIDRVIVSRDISVKPPRYFDKLFSDIDFSEMEKIKQKRINSHADDVLPSVERLVSMEKAKSLQIKKLIRCLE